MRRLPDLSSLKHSRTLSILLLFLIFSAIFLTAFVIRKRQEYRQRAVGPTCNNTGVTKNADGTYTFAQLHVDSHGNVTDSQGCIIHLVGLNQGWLASGAGSYDSASEINSWHQAMPYNLIRLNYNSYWWNTNVPVPAYNNTPFQQVLKQAISEAEKAGVYIELDTGPQHIEPPCGGNNTLCSSQNQAAKDYAADPACQTNPTGCPEAKETPAYPPTGDQSITDLTKLYAHDPAVIFNVWNEPGDGNFSALLPDPQFFPAMQNRINIVNTNAPNSLVVVYAHSFPAITGGTQKPYTGHNIIIDHHAYAPTQTVAQHIPDRQFDQQHGWGDIINEYGGTMLTAGEQQVMTTLAQQYNVGLAFFTASNLHASKNLPIVLNPLGQLVNQSYRSIFGTTPVIPSIQPTNPTQGIKSVDTPTPTLPFPNPTNTPTPTPSIPQGASPTTPPSVVTFCGANCHANADCDTTGFSCGICDPGTNTCIASGQASGTPPPPVTVILSVTVTMIPTQTQTPGPATGTLSVHFEGIDPQNNPAPHHQLRHLTLSFYNTQDFTKPPVAVLAETVIFSQSDPNGAFVNNAIDLSSIPDGSYYVLAKSQEGSLREKISPSQITITKGAMVSLNGTASSSPITLRMGDLNNDNSVNITDYNILVDCFSAKATSLSCKSHQISDNYVSNFADFNDDGLVNGIDYNILIRNLGNQGLGTAGQ